MQGLGEWLNANKTTILAILTAAVGAAQGQGVVIPPWVTAVMAGFAAGTAPHSAAVQNKQATLKAKGLMR